MAAIHVSNILGAVLDAAALVATVRGGPCGPRARVALDGVAFAPHLPIDAAAWGVDWCGSTCQVDGLSTNETGQQTSSRPPQQKCLRMCLPA